MPGSVSLYDARTFFEKALQYGVQHAIINVQRLDAIRLEAPKGMVQIARYFGTEFLRPELEKARDRIVNLVSLYLESTTQGDLKLAAESLRDHSFLSRSKGGSDMLKSLIVMPQNSHFGMNERSIFNDGHIPVLARWSLRTLADYQAELALRSRVSTVVDAAVWLADELGMDADELEEAGKDAEAVIRTALLALATGLKKMPDWPAFEKMVIALRKREATATKGSKSSGKPGKEDALRARILDKPLDVSLPKGLPAEFEEVVETLRQSVLKDLPRIMDDAASPRQLFDRTPSFTGRYFWIEDAVAEINHHDRMASDAWNKVTGGHSDEGSLLTMLLCIAAGAPPKTLLTEKGAAALVRKIRTSGFNAELARQYLADHAPAQYQQDYEELWLDFVDEAEATLRSDAVNADKDALSLLRRECHVK